MPKKPIAVRSLQCPDHAYNLPPTVTSALWFVGKRCNYDCSYCSPHIHDAVSPFIKVDQATHFATTIDQQCLAMSRRMKWAFTGGEPLLDPGFLALADHIRKLSTTEQMNVITNGSMPLKIYLKAADIFQGITVSLHLERSDQELQDIIDKLPLISKNCFVTVNLMFLPGRLQKIKSITNILKSQDTPFIVRKITPLNHDQDNLPFETVGQGRKQARLKDIEEQSKSKFLWKIKSHKKRARNMQEFYDKKEIDYLSSANQGQIWQNCGVWYDDSSYAEINSDHLVANDQINFKNWICYAGIDNIHIDFDGKIYRGTCQNDGPIGHISQKFVFPDKPTKCHTDWCLCNTDITVRKAVSSDLSLINGQQL